MFPGEINILKVIESMRNDFLNTFFDIITFLGEEMVIIALLAVIYFAIDKSFAKKLFFVTVASLNINGIVKNFAKVPRPFASGEVTCLKESTATGYAFPSGHTQTFATWSITASLKLKKWWIFLISAILIVLIGFSRMYLGAHYLSDVIVGALFGVIFAIAFSIIFDKVNNKFLLYTITSLVLLPFIIYFLITADKLYADTFKTFGMVTGLIFVEWFETKYVNFDIKTVWWKKLIRIVGAFVLAIGVKEVLKLTYASCDIVQVNLIMDALRYFVVVSISFAIWPYVIKKLNI